MLTSAWAKVRRSSTLSQFLLTTPMAVPTVMAGEPRVTQLTNYILKESPCIFQINYVTPLQVLLMRATNMHFECISEVKVSKNWRVRGTNRCEFFAEVWTALRTTPNHVWICLSTDPVFNFINTAATEFDPVCRAKHKLGTVHYTEHNPSITATPHREEWVFCALKSLWCH